MTAQPYEPEELSVRTQVELAQKRLVAVPAEWVSHFMDEFAETDDEALEAVADDAERLARGKRGEALNWRSMLGAGDVST